MKLSANFDLEEPCSRCYGDGFEPSGPPLVVCHKCKGSSYEPTESGMILLEFFRSYKDRFCLECGLVDAHKMQCGSQGHV